MYVLTAAVSSHYLKKKEDKKPQKLLLLTSWVCVMWNTYWLNHWLEIAKN